MNIPLLRFAVVVLLFNVSIPIVARAADAQDESSITPNQRRRVVQVNHDLPTDMQSQPRDSRQVAELRDNLRQAYAVYRQTVKQYGSSTPNAHLAAHELMDVQVALHKQFVQEEATPVVASR
jgi:hypothetical protein